MRRRLVVEAPAKVNLHLGISPTITDGYHSLCSVFHCVDLTDILLFTESDSFSLECSPDVGASPEDNLVFKAAQEMGRVFSRKPNVRISLTKRIPHGAGLGGGSADAAATILALAMLWDVDPHGEDCLSVARTLGADVAFFLWGGAALMGGRGDILERLLPAISAPVVLVKPHDGISTARAYAAFDDSPVKPSSPTPLMDALAATKTCAEAAVDECFSDNLRAIAKVLDNNLTAASISILPEVAVVLDWLASQDGALRSLVSGSGSTVFSLCTDRACAQRIAREASKAGYWSVATSLRETGVTIREEIVEEEV